MRRLLPLVTAAGLGACAPIPGPVVVEAVVPAQGDVGGVGIDDVTLERVLDLRTGHGRDFDVRGDTTGALDLMALCSADDAPR